MNKKFGVFFNINDLDSFFKNVFFTAMGDSYGYKIVNKRSNNLSVKRNCLYHEGYIYMQRNSFVIFENNEIDGWSGLIRFCALNNKLEAAYVSVNTEQPYPAYILYYYKDGKERIIQNIKEAGWTFWKEGEQQKFEHNDTYSEKGVLKKFDFTKIKCFCGNLGMNIEDPDFFEPHSNIYYTYRIPKNK